MQSTEVKPYKVGTLCRHSSGNYTTAFVDIVCLDEEGVVHRVSQIGNMCKKCATLIAKSVSSDQQQCLCCSEKLEEYLDERWICTHENRTEDEITIKCVDEAGEIHDVPYKSRVCKNCNDKIRSAFMHADKCVVCAQGENQLFLNLEKTIIYPSFYYYEYVIENKQNKQLTDQQIKSELQSFCLSRYRDEEQESRRTTKLMFGSVAAELGENRQIYHASKRYQLYPRCEKHKKQPIIVCNSCLVSLLNLETCPYGCSYQKLIKKKVKTDTTHRSETGLVCLYPKTYRDYQYLQFFCVRLIEEASRLEKWEGFLRKIRYSGPEKDIIPRFKMYGSALQIDSDIFLVTGGVTLSDGIASTSSFEIRFTKDRKQFTLEAVTEMSSGRASHGSVFCDGTAYVIGGFVNGNTCLNSCQKYNRGAKRWEAIAPMKIERSKPSVFAKKGFIYVLGGLSINQQLIDNLVERYDPQNNKWQAIAYNGYGTPSLTGVMALDNQWTLPQHSNTVFVGGSNYQQMTYMIQEFQLKDMSFDISYSQQKLNYGRVSPVTSVMRTSKADEFVVIVFGGLQDHEYFLNIDSVRVQIKDNEIVPLFAYDDVNLKSYRLMLRQGVDRVYQQMYRDLQKLNLINSQKLQKEGDGYDLSKSMFNSHVIQKMWYGVGKTFIGLSQ